MKTAAAAVEAEARLALPLAVTLRLSESLSRTQALATHVTSLDNNLDNSDISLIPGWFGPRATLDILNFSLLIPQKLRKFENSAAIQFEVEVDMTNVQ